MSKINEFDFKISEDKEILVTYPNGLQFISVELNSEFAKKYNERCNDFFVLGKNGVPLSNQLYRKGGCFIYEPKAKIFMVLKYTPDVYSPKIMKIAKSKNNKYLKCRDAVITINGVEVFESEPFKNISVISNSILFTYNSNIHSIIGDVAKPICKIGYNTINTENFYITSGDGVAYKIFKHSGEITTIK